MRRHARALFVIAALASFFAFAGTAAAEFESTGSFSGPGTGDGEISTPGRAAVEQSTGNLFVVDSANNRVQVFKPNGSGGADYLTQFGSGQLAKPWGLALDEQGGQTYVYVADAGNDRIVKFDSNEAATPSFSVNGSFTSPTKGGGAGQVGDFKVALAIDPGSHDLLVADAGNDRVARFSSSGAALNSFNGSAGAGSPGSFNNLLDIAVNSGGDVYVIDANGPEIRLQQGTSQALRYSAAGSYKATLSPVGSEQRPATVAVNPANDEVAVSGNQAATFADQPPTLHTFDVANTPLVPLTLGAAYNTVTGLAFGPGAKTQLYMVMDYGFWNGFQQFGSPKIERFADVKRPIVAIDPVPTGSITRDEAEFTGSVNPNGFATEWHFEYSADGSNWISTPTQSAGAGDSSVPVSVAVGGLTVATGYQVRLMASNSEGTKASGSESFTTAAAVREVNTGTASALTPTTATVNGTINPGGVSLSECKFEYGTTEALGQSVACAETLGSIGSGEAPVPVHADLAGLSTGRYYFRLVASNSFGTTQGAVETMGTPGAPVLLEQSAGSEAFRAVIVARINPNSAPTTYHFEYGPTAAYGESSEEIVIAPGADPVKVAQELKELQPLSTYHFRVVVSNSYGSVQGPDRTFTTDAAPAAGPCPNAPIRAEQGAIALPECRAYELVSPPDKLGLGVFAVPYGRSLTSASPDGTAANFQSTGAFADAQVGRTLNDYVSKRGPSGWTTHSISSVEYVTRSTGGLSVGGWSEDLSRAAVFTDGHPENPLTPGGVWYRNNLYFNDWQSGAFQLASLDPPGPVPAEPEFNGQLKFIDGSSDLSYMGFVDDQRHTANAPAGVVNPYLWHDGEVELVSILPDPDGSGPLVGQPAPNGAALGSVTNRRGAVSQDGSRVVFTTPDGRIYVRLNGMTTVEVARSQKSIPGAPQSAEFQAVSDDGRFVFFSTREQLLDSDTNPVAEGGDDLYRYDVETGNLIRISTGPNGDGGFRTLAGVSADGSTVYFAALLVDYVAHPEVEDEVVSEFVWRNGTIKYVANGTAVGPDSSVSITADGDAITFTTQGAQNLGNGEVLPAQPEAQVYLYRFDTGRLECASCRRDGQDPVGPATLPMYVQESGPGSVLPVSESHVLSDDGKRVFFTTPDSLVAADSNEKVPDVYEYVNGRQYLISSGLSKFESVLLNASADGSTVFFTTLDRLVRRDGDEGVDLYAARIDGGFSEPPPPVPCTGEACKAGSTSPPQETAATTPQFSGPGNANERAQQKAKCKKQKHKKKSCKQKKKKKRAAKSRGASKRGVGK